MDQMLETFVSVFLVANILPILPVVLDAVEELPRRRRRRTLLSALMVGNAVALAFGVAGGFFLDAMQSGLDDLRIAGGLILLVFAIYDLLFSREQRKEPLNAMMDEDSEVTATDVSLVPLGIPLMVGPATLTAILVLSEGRGIGIASLAVVINALINALILVLGGQLLEFLGRGTIRTVGKVFGLLLAAIAVSMIRVGVNNTWVH